MRNKNINKIFIWGFLFLYALVALISFIHAADFFSVGNTEWMSYTLAFAFELGLAVCLAYILLAKSKNNIIAWILMTMLVVVQIIGNTYSVFKYISLSDTNYYQYLAKPLLFWIEEVSENTIQVIISWIMGAILPVVALLMTGMVSRTINGASDDEKVREIINEDTTQDHIETDVDNIDVVNRDINENQGKFPEVNVPDIPMDTGDEKKSTEYLGQ